MQTLIFKLLRICREGWKLYRNFWNFWSEKLKIEILRAKLEAWNKVCSSCAADTFALEISQMVWYFAKVKELVQISFFVFLFRVRPLIIWLLDVFLKCTITAFLRYSIRLWSERIRPRTNIWWPRVYFKQIILTKALQKYVAHIVTLLLMSFVSKSVNCSSRTKPLVAWFCLTERCPVLWNKELFIEQMLVACWSIAGNIFTKCYGIKLRKLILRRF